MEIKINVNVELGHQTLAILTNGIKVESSTNGKADEAPQTGKEKKSRTRASAPKADEPIDKEEKPVTFADQDADAQLEAIKSEVTKHTKKGKSADIKALLGGFDAGRASELSPDNYVDFFEAIQRYGKGESVEEILELV